MRRVAKTYFHGNRSWVNSCVVGLTVHQCGKLGERKNRFSWDVVELCEMKRVQYDEEAKRRNIPDFSPGVPSSPEYP